MKKNKFFSIFASIIACVLMLCSVTQAATYDKVDYNDVRKRITTTVTIKDINTGEVTQYELDNDNVKIVFDPTSSETTLEMNDIGNGISAFDASQSNSNTFYGWKGNVRITWYQDGTWARLTSAGGDWTRVSGSYSMTDKSITYGQQLGTNGRNGSANFINSYNVAPNWPLGKYGHGHTVGATISGFVNNQYVSISCNYSLF